MNPNATITDEQFKQYLKEVREMVEGPYTEWQKEIEVTNKFPEKFYQSNIEHNIYRFSLPVEYGGWGLNEKEILQVQEEFSRGPSGMRMHMHYASDLNWRILAQVLYHRYKAGKKGIIMLACELIDNNGKELLKCVNQYIDQWGLEDGFKKYVNEDCTFCGSLVDRIVPGRIRDPKEVAELEEKHGYADPLLDVGEVFGVWVIEGDTKLNDILPFRKAGLEDHVFVTPDMSPYKKRKVRILNGAHTGFVLGAYLAGFDIVRDCMHDETILGYMNKMLLQEVVPILPLDQDDCKKFAAAVEDRFNNPFVNHELMSISLNSTSKWRARNMPSFLEYIEKNGKLPTCLTMSFAAYIAFYSNNIQELNDKGLVCKRAKGNEYTISDDRYVLEFYNAHKDDDIPTLVHAVMTNEQMWGQDLTKVAGFEEATVKNLTLIREQGAMAAYKSCL